MNQVMTIEQNGQSVAAIGNIELLKRNQFVATMCDDLYVPHANPGGRIGGLLQIHCENCI